MTAVGSASAVAMPPVAAAPVDMSAIVTQLQAVVAQLGALVQALQAQQSTSGAAAGAATLAGGATGGGPAASATAAASGCGCGGAAGAAGGPTQLADTDATGGANGAPDAPTTPPAPKADDAKKTDAAKATSNDGGLSAKQKKIVDFGKAQLGKSYVFAAAGPDHFDCSGLTMKALEQVGVKLPHSAEAQSKMGTAVDKKDLQPGDLVFFEKPVGHTGIYIGDGKVLHAPQTGDVVKVSSLDDKWYKDNYAGARRFV